MVFAVLMVLWSEENTFDRISISGGKESGTDWGLAWGIFLTV
jgi:hypothetical protein